jgi:PTH2 family peptidyl-tRNA hydrolase
LCDPYSGGKLAARTDVSVKQVIVMRNDLNMRKGKMIAQGSHAAMMFLVGRVIQASHGTSREIEFSEEMWHWLSTGRMTKVCVRVDSEVELLEIQRKCCDAHLPVYLITDAGMTEFAGVPTKTCLAIGPASAEKIDQITGHLKLL